MRVFEKCKNSVFCVFFILCFFFGTICGVLLYNLFAAGNSGFVILGLSNGIKSYSGPSMSSFISSFTVLFSVYLISFFSFATKLRWIFIAWRGCSVSYLFCMLLHSGYSVLFFLFREFIFLSSFYIVCTFSIFLRNNNRSKSLRYDMFLICFMVLVSALCALL